VQEALRREHGLQCGFCTPGFVVSITAYLRDHPDPGENEILEAVSGNICRCTGYQGIRRAVGVAAALMRENEP
jgi:carbon-monoxide dehydrogenase small subunit